MTTLALGKSIHSIFTYVEKVDDYIPNSISIISDISKTFLLFPQFRFETTSLEVS